MLGKFSFIKTFDWLRIPSQFSFTIYILFQRYVRKFSMLATQSNLIYNEFYMRRESTLKKAFASQLQLIFSSSSKSSPFEMVITMYRYINLLQNSTVPVRRNRQKICFLEIHNGR